MKPFIEIPIIIVNSDNEKKQVLVRQQPEWISYYYPGFHQGTVIVLKCGNSFLTPHTVEEVDAILLAYDKLVKANPNQFGNLKLTQKQSPLVKLN